MSGATIHLRLPPALAAAAGGTGAEAAANAGANAVFGNEAGLGGFLRTGSFVTSSTGKTLSGAGEYGLNELSGNVWERVITVGNATGRASTALHGNGAVTAAGLADVGNWPDATAVGTGARGGGHADGQLTAEGAADATNWPGSNALGAGIRGGGFSNDQSVIKIADPSWAARTDTTRQAAYGGRGVRSRICTVPTVQPDSIVVDTPPFDNILELTTGGAGSGEGCLWITPNDWRVINGQGTNSIFINVGAYPVTIRVVIVNECGAGQERTLVLTN